MNLFHQKQGRKIGSSRRLISFLRSFGRDPYFDWVVIVFVSFIFAAALVLLGTMMYLGADPAAGIATASTSPSLKLDTATLQKVLDGYDGQRGLRDSLLHGYAGPGDPSI